MDCLLPGINNLDYTLFLQKHYIDLTTDASS